MIFSCLRFATVGGFSVLLFGLLPAPAFAAEKVLVADELERLAKEYGFSVQGLDQTEEVFSRTAGDGLYHRLRLLLENFDHVIIQSPQGSVERVIVLGEKVPFEPTPPPAPAGARGPEVDEGGDIVVETQRRGTQHVVRASLEGGSGGKVERELHVDTGADFLVLPQSLISKLGMDEDQLEERDMQTANGRAKARIGTVPALWLGGRRIAGVEAAFVEDKRLGGNGLLGMSVLRRYKLTIDDDKNRIILSSKADGASAEEAPAAAGEELGNEEEAGSSDSSIREP